MRKKQMNNKNIYIYLGSLGKLRNVVMYQNI